MMSAEKNEEKESYLMSRFLLETQSRDVSERKLYKDHAQEYEGVSCLSCKVPLKN